MDELYPEEIGQLIEVATKLARQKGFELPLPVSVSEVEHPVTHWEILGPPVGGERLCVMLDRRSQLLNIEMRPVVIAPPKPPWWKRLLGLQAPPQR